jgi:hypothetical protein
MNHTCDNTVLVGGRASEHGLTGAPEDWSPEIFWQFGLEQTEGSHVVIMGCPQDRAGALRRRDELNASLKSGSQPWRVLLHIGSGIPGGELLRVGEVASH